MLNSKVCQFPVEENRERENVIYMFQFNNSLLIKLYEASFQRLVLLGGAVIP